MDLTELWEPEPGWLNTASYGLPPRPAWDAVQAAMADWRVGRTSWEGWDAATGRSRDAFARLVGVDPADVAVGSAVSQLLAPVAAALPDGATVVVPAGEFASKTPSAAGWYAGEDVHASYYGPPMRLAASARRFDISPAWFSYVGTAPALELVERIGVATIGAHNVALANRFLAGLKTLAGSHSDRLHGDGRPPGTSAIVTVDVPGAEAKLAAAGVRAAVRAGRVRASFHVYNTDADVDLALNALT